MSWTETPEQTLLRESVRRFCANEYHFSKLRKALESGTEPVGCQHWPTLVELGWLLPLVPEEYGGFGGDAADVAIICEELGAGLVLEPFIGCGVLPLAALAVADRSEQLESLVVDALAGRRVLAMALSEHGISGELEKICLHATKLENGYRLSGTKTAILGGPFADTVLVAARTSGNSAEEEGISLFIVDSASVGVSRIDYHAVDNSARSDITFDDVVVDANQLVGAEGSAHPALEAAVNLAIIAAAAESVGAMDRALWATCDYLRERRQYGRALSDFQALQHRMADMYIWLEQANSILLQGILGLQSPDRSARNRAVSAVKIVMAQAGRFIAGQAIQLHGGIGVTEEYPVGHYFRRIEVLNSLFGSETYHLGRLGDLLVPELQVAL